MESKRVFFIAQMLLCFVLKIHFLLLILLRKRLKPRSFPFGVKMNPSSRKLKSRFRHLEVSPDYSPWKLVVGRLSFPFWVRFIFKCFCCSFWGRYLPPPQFYHQHRMSGGSGGGVRSPGFETAVLAEYVWLDAKQVPRPARCLTELDR